jgi:hypothetical protein
VAKTTVTFRGERLTFSSKKDMLKYVGKALLDGSDGPMTLRQLYYRFVAHDLVDNKQSQYDYLGEAMKEARLEGYVPWSAIEDRTRGTEAGDRPAVSARDRFERARGFLEGAPDRHARPRWEGQQRYVEVWVEKEALAGVLRPVCDELGVELFPNRGYTSVTMLHEAAERISERTPEGGRAEVLYLGDFDPSGQDIERNAQEKLRYEFGTAVEVERIALTRPQIDERGLPPQPAKSTDSRYEDFVAEHGDLAVELDALEPEVLRDLVREEVGERFDEDAHERARERGDEESDRIRGWVEDYRGG